MTNMVFLEGNVTREPDARVNEHGSTRWSTTLAVPEVRWDSRQNQEVIHTNWIFLTAALEVADQLVAANITKSCKLSVRGRIGTYVKDTNGAKETKTQVEVTGFDVIRRPFGGGNSNSSQSGDWNNNGGGWNAGTDANAGGWGNPPQQTQQQAPQQQNPPQTEGGGWTNDPRWGGTQ